MGCNMILNVNSDEVVAFTNKLEKLSKSAFPVAVRGTLNDSAFDVKTRTMPVSSKSAFEERQPNFFKANSKFLPALGFNLNAMYSDVGFYENRLKNSGSNYAVKDLEQQESGGTIQKKTFIPLPKARRGGKGVVRANARLSTIKRIIKVHNNEGLPKAIALAGKGGFVLNDKALFRVLPNRRIEPLYSYRSNRSVTVGKTEFMKEASMITAKKMDGFYINQALRQFRKAGVLK